MSAMIDMRQILDVIQKQMKIIKEKDRQIAKLEELLKKKVKSVPVSSSDKKKQKENSKKILIKEVISLYKKWFKQDPSDDASKTLSEYSITDLRRVVSDYKKKLREREKDKKNAILPKKSSQNKRDKTRTKLQKELSKLTGKETTETSIVKLRKLISEKTPKKEKTSKKEKKTTKKEEVGKREIKKMEIAKEYGILTNKGKSWDISKFIKGKTTIELRSLVKCQKLLNKK